MSVQEHLSFWAQITTMATDTREVIIAVWAGATSIILAYLTYRRSVKVDAVSAQAGMTDRSTAGTAQIIEGLNRLLDQVQEDNKDLRDEARGMLVRLAAQSAENDQMRRRLYRYSSKYGDNGNGNSTDTGK